MFFHPKKNEHSTIARDITGAEAAADDGLTGV
jgi:hypothetical protein